MPTSERGADGQIAGRHATPSDDGVIVQPQTSADDAPEDHGRIGYGRYGRYTPLALALLLIGSLLLIGLYQEDPSPAPVLASQLVGEPAPDVTLTLLDGTPLHLADLRGSVVALNFWASWCDPCVREAPAFQAVHDAAAKDGERVVVVGVGIKNDTDEAARAFVRELGLTYPIGRDTGGADRTRGPIERAFGIEGLYPTTVFIAPDGAIASVHLGELTAAQLQDYIQAAEG